MDVMNEELKDTGLDFNQLLALLHLFPERSDWEERGVDGLYEDVRKTFSADFPDNSSCFFDLK